MSKALALKHQHLKSKVRIIQVVGYLYKNSSTNCDKNSIGLSFLKKKLLSPFVGRSQR